MTVKKKTKPAAKAKVKVKAAPKVSDQARKKLIVTAAMAIAADKGWAAVSSLEVAKRTKLPRADVAALMPDKHDILRHLGEIVDGEMQAGGVAEGSLRDRLFDVTMRRFDALMPYRDGVKAVVAAIPGDIAMPLALLGQFDESMTATLETADVQPSLMRKFGFALVALAAFRVWLEDDSADLAKTMAELDRRLGQLEEAAQALAPFLAKK